MRLRSMALGEFPGSSRFQIRRRIGSGSFGIVYEAFDPVRNQVVAVKALRHAYPEALYRFKREFRSLTGIVDRNLIRLYELISEGEQLLVSMELIEGLNFIEYVRGALGGEPEGQPPGSEPAGLVESFDTFRLGVALPQLARGVIALHNAGKLHRDIKPSNVLVADDQRVVLLDFGLVMDTSSRFTQSSTSTSGTPAYMSPEQGGGGGQALGPPSDWYSVGVMLYQALTGQVPFHGTYLEILTAKQNSDVPPPSTVVAEVPEHLDALCRDLLRVDPKARP
ncbi:MAG TPA: serine/threonine-protein kinase, partial [Thermoanaerobaculia bacterium]|nr:serine/threonine-protein kinase [Thermoanaerobaculia bacterium]